MSTRLTAALLAGIGLLTTLLVATPARALAPLALPVDCSTDKTVLRWDDLSYDLNGTCGVVVVRASNVEVDMPTAQKLVLHGHGNSVVSKPVVTVVVRGHDQHLALPSARRVRIASPGSVVRVEGLVEHARISGRDATLTARQVTDLTVRGHGHRVTARRGYDAAVPGDRNRLRFRRLDALHVGGDHNLVRVRRGETEVHATGTDNRVRVHRRG